MCIRDRDKEKATKALIFYPGGRVQYTAYAPLMHELAKNNFVCILVHMPGNLAVLDQNAADGIIEKYKDMDSDGKLLPMLTKESMNRHLKKMSVMCGINRPISFHQARHTFGSIICLSQGIPIETVSKIMGHRHITTTQRYAKVTQDKIDKDMDGLNDIIGGKFTLSGIDTAPSPILKDYSQRKVNPSMKQREYITKMMEG